MKERLGDLCEIVSGSTPKTDVPEYWGGTNNWITPAEIDENTQIIYESQRKITDLAVQSIGLHSFPKGTVILSSRAPIGKVAIAGTEMYCNQGFKNLICSEKIYNKYLYWLLKGETDYLNSLGRGATFKEISKKIVSNIEIEVPPLDVQYKRAETRDLILQIKTQCKLILSKLEDLVKSRFTEMFGGYSEKNKVSLSRVCKLITDGTHQPPIFTESGVPFLFVSNIVSNSINYETEKFISIETYYELIKRTPIEVGDILLSTVGSYGHPAIVTEKRKFCFQRHIAYLKPNNELIRSMYLYGVILSDDVQMQIEKGVRGIAQKTLNLSEIKNILVPLPPLDEQKKYEDFLNHVGKSKVAVQLLIDKLSILENKLIQEWRS